MYKYVRARMSVHLIWVLQCHTSFFLPGRLIDNGAVLQTSQIEHAHATVLTTADKDVDAVGAETYVVDFFVVGDQLGLCRQ